MDAKEVLRNASIIEVAGNYIEVHGSSLKSAKAVCPFHEDHNPSMSFYRSKKGEERYHCFVCHADGNAADFVINYEKEYHGRTLSFPEAVAKVAEICDLEYEYHGSMKPSKPRSIREINVEKLQTALGYYIRTKPAASVIEQIAKEAGLEAPAGSDMYFRLKEELHKCGAGMVPPKKELAKLHPDKEGFNAVDEIKRQKLSPGTLTFPQKRGGKQTGFLRNGLFAPEDAGRNVLLCRRPEEVIGLRMLGIKNAVSAWTLDQTALKELSEKADRVTVLESGDSALKRASELMKGGISADILPMTVSEIGKAEGFRDRALRPYAYALSLGAAYDRAEKYASTPLEKFDCRRKSELLSELERAT